MTDTETKELQKQLFALKDLTERTGILHELQVNQLRMWSLITTHAVKSETHFDYEHRKVIFNLTEVKGPKPDKWKQRLETLTKWVQNLLGDQYTVSVQIKGKEESKCLVQPNSKNKKKKRS